MLLVPACYNDVSRQPESLGVREYVRTLDDVLPEIFMIEAGEVNIPEALARRVGSVRWHESISPQQAAAVVAHYESVGYRPLFLFDNWPTDNTWKVLDLVRQIESHALEPAPYQVHRIEFLLSRLAVLNTHRVALQFVDLTSRENELLVATLLLKAPDPVDIERVDAPRQGFDWLISPGDSPIPRLSSQFESYRTILNDIEETASELDVLLAIALVRYADELSYSWRNRYSPQELEGTEFELLRTQRLDQLLESTSSGGLDDLLAALPPPHPQYEQLRRSRTRYVNLVKSGGFPVVESGKLTFNKRSETAQHLKQRLTVEGYYDGPIDDLFDSALEQAIYDYQWTHQLQQTRKLDKTFYKSLNTTAEQRLASIDLNLERWRRTRLKNTDSTFIFVNIPLYVGQVFARKSPIHTFRVVVGNTHRAYDKQKKKKVLRNNTPILRARIKKVIYNPYWNVPKRIREEELDPNLEKNPLWYEENNFELMHEGKKYEYIRQKPGPGNALGRVKLIFPNPYEIYMHDTPAKSLFNKPTRAFSHGCVRVEHPLELAQVVLDLDGQWDARKVDKILNPDHLGEEGVEYEQVEINLQASLTIIIEYVTVWVDDNGRTMYLTDVYKYDQDREKELSYP